MWSSLESTSHSILGKKGWCAKVVRITHACQCENVAWFPKRSHRMTMEHYENRVCLTYGNGNLVMYFLYPSWILGTETIFQEKSIVLDGMAYFTFTSANSWPWKMCFKKDFLFVISWPWVCRGKRKVRHAIWHYAFFLKKCFRS